MKNKTLLLAVMLVGIGLQAESPGFAAPANIIPGQYRCAEASSGISGPSITIGSDQITFTGFLDVASAHQGQDVFWISDGLDSDNSEAYILKQPGFLGMGSEETDYKVDDGILTGASSGSLILSNAQGSVPTGSQASNDSDAYTCTRN
ncbi:MAG: hypothetical protein P4M08_13845 [Oligoflexia bacterium]|nr:hypothetical protein [Oligoflexia bacterium]